MSGSPRKLLLPFVLFAAITSAQIPPGYYDPAQGLYGEELRMALNDIISPHAFLQYTQLWGAFYRTDRKPNNDVWDIYSDVPSGTPAYTFQFVADQCGNYNGEGDCFNREHTFPVSWFGDALPMNTDLHHIYPTDAWVNNQRGSWPYGMVNAPTYTSSNGGKRGPCSWPGCSGTVFEPIDAYKGDLARGHLYMLTRYMNEANSWSAPILSLGEFIPWTESLLLAWHTQDPVSAKETARNDSIYQIQGNRNPYIDNPQWAYSIWGPLAAVPELGQANVRAYFDGENLVVRCANVPNSTRISVLDATGRTVTTSGLTGGSLVLPFDAATGVYTVVVGSDGIRYATRFVR